MSGRSALAAMWAKTGPGDTWHRLTFHVLDVAAVAQLLLERHVPRRLRAKYAARLGVSAGDFDRWVLLLVSIHDLGKASPPFQAKFPPRARALAAMGLSFPRRITDVPHGQISASAEGFNRLVARGWPAGLARQAVRWVGGHHGVFPSDAAQVDAVDHAGIGDWALARDVLFDELWSLFAPTSLPKNDDTVADIGLFVAGLTSVADWIGSMSDHFPFETGDVPTNDYFERALAKADVALARVGWRHWPVGPERSFDELFGFSPRPLQRGIADLVKQVDEQFFAIVEAPMGEGKTEAAFWVAHELARRADHRGTYFALPTMATANQMFARTRRFLEASYQGPLSAQLLHGGADFSEEFSSLRSVVDDHESRRPLAVAQSLGTVVAQEWFSKKKRGLLASFAVGTIDQALLGVMRTRHGFVRLFGLSGKTVVLDEVHAYDAFTSRILDRMVAWLKRLGASVVILSATLPRARREELCRQWAQPGSSSAEYPRITAFADDVPLAVTLPCGASKAVRVENLSGDIEGALNWLTSRIDSGGCAGLILNTVTRAQQATRLVRERWPEVDVLLLHARFFSDARQAREKRLLDLLGKSGQRPHRIIVIGTQVLEQSLDIDFDVLATDHAPVDLMLQRTGRLHRHLRSRPATLSEPVLGIVEPRSTEKGPSFGVHALIYEEAILLRSWLAMRGRNAIKLPSDIEPLIEQVYGTGALQCPAEFAQRLQACDDELAESVRSVERNAEGRLLTSPDLCVDDPFRDFGSPLDEDNPDVARQLQAVTRLGEPTVQVACLEDPALIARKPTMTEVKCIVGRTLSFSNKAIYYALRSQPVPQAWQESSWLRNTKALVFEGGRAVAGKKELRDDPELGVVITQATEEDT